MRVYILIILAVMVVGATSAAHRAYEAATHADFTAEYPADDPRHGHEREILAAMRRQAAERNLRDRLAENAAHHPNALEITETAWRNRPTIVLFPGMPSI